MDPTGSISHDGHPLRPPEKHNALRAGDARACTVVAIDPTRNVLGPAPLRRC